MTPLERAVAALQDIADRYARHHPAFRPGTRLTILVDAPISTTLSLTNRESFPCPRCEARRRQAETQPRNAWGWFTRPGAHLPAKRPGKPPALKTGQLQPRDWNGRFVPATAEARRTYRPGKARVSHDFPPSMLILHDRDRRTG